MKAPERCVFYVCVTALACTALVTLSKVALVFLMVHLGAIGGGTP
jgi:hypothetical protein